MSAPLVHAPGGAQRTGKFPVLDKMAMGGRPAPQADALGRYVQRVNEKRKATPYRTPKEGANPRGGMPQMRSPQAMIPALRKAAAKMGLPPSVAADPKILARIQALGVVPQKMASQLGTSDPLAQAMKLLRTR